MYTKEIESFNRPHQTTVAIDCREIGDDNDYSCFLAGCVYQLWLAGHKEKALRLANTDPMLISNYTEDTFEAEMQRHTQYLIEQKESEKLYYKLYRD